MVFLEKYCLEAKHDNASCAKLKALYKISDSLALSNTIIFTYCPQYIFENHLKLSSVDQHIFS